MERAVFGGEPDRYVNQYEAIKLLFSPFMFRNPMAQKGGPEVVNLWGVTNYFPSNVPGAFPVHTPEKILVKDIEHWRDYVKIKAEKGPVLRFEKILYKRLPREVFIRIFRIAYERFIKRANSDSLKNKINRIM